MWTRVSLQQEILICHELYVWVDAKKLKTGSKCVTGIIKMCTFGGEN